MSNISTETDSSTKKPNLSLSGKRVAVVVLSDYPNDPRPRREAEALVEQGMSVEVICSKRHQDDPAHLTLNGVNIYRLPITHQRGGKLGYAFQYFGFLTASFVLLAFRSCKGRYSLVHVHNMPDFLVFSAIVPKLLGSKVILDMHDPMPELMRTIYGIAEHSRAVRLLKIFEKISLGFAGAVITVNKTCKNMFAERSCLPEKISVIMNSPDEAMFPLIAPAPTESTTRKRPFVVMYHGSLVERNGLGLAIEAIRIVRKKLPDVELHIYGHHTPFLETVLPGVKKGQIEEGIRYLGPRKIEEVVEAIDQCDLGIVPNLRNIFTEINTPTRIFEFLSRGKPVVAPSSQGVLEYFGENDLVLFELGNAPDLAHQIEFVMENPETVFEITKRGQAVCMVHRWCREKELLITQIKRLLEAGASLQGASTTPENRPFAST